MTEHPARRLWLSIETLHDVVYFAPEIRGAGTALGLRGFWMTYFAFRAAPLGSVGPDPVVAAFAGFEPGMVAKSLHDAWSRTTPQACIAARCEVSASVLGGLGVDGAACGRAVALLAGAVASADRTGRALFAANAAIPLADNGVEALWQVATSLREHRGDGHVAALVSAGISGLEAHVLQVAAGRMPKDAIIAARGWSGDDWAAAVGRLAERDLVSDDPLGLTERGHGCLYEIEAATDNSAFVGALLPLGEHGVDEVVSILAPSVDAVRRSGVLPAFNPTGLKSEPPPAG
jgi:hypothetical protein